jgi:hypothetical protein
MSQDVDVAVVSPDLEVPMIRSEPAIENLLDDDAPVVDEEIARRLLPAMPGVTIHRDAHVSFRSG